MQNAELRKLNLLNNQSRGALARYRDPSAVNKAAYVISNFVTPAPSFASLGKLLAGQAFKGVKDNIDYYRGGNLK